jgi:hypothetical protein
MSMLGSYGDDPTNAPTEREGGKVTSQRPAGVQKSPVVKGGEFYSNDGSDDGAGARANDGFSADKGLPEGYRPPSQGNYLQQ